MRVFVPTRVLRVLTLRTQSGLVLGSPLSCPGLPARITSVVSVPACPGGPQTHPDSHGPSPTHAVPSGGAQPRSGPEPTSLGLCSSPRGCDWEVRGRGVTVGCSDRVRGDKALPLLRADFQNYLSVKT